jgi:hypothetical protein
MQAGGNTGEVLLLLHFRTYLISTFVKNNGRKYSEAIIK